MKGAAADWSDLALFSAVARAGALAPAARSTGVSVPTLSRRMKALEARMGRRLFLHGAQGYAPTTEGRDLLERTARMEAAAADIAAWQAAGRGPARIRVTAGTWTARHLAANLPAFWTPDAAWLPEFVHCNIDMDIARREVDIGIRNRRPSQPWLAGRRTGTTTHAAYAANAGVTAWIGASHETRALPSETWVAETHGDSIVTTANDPALRLILAQAGIGRVVLPTFVGDTAPGLVRVSDIIAELTREVWLVCHHEARHDAPIRAALDAIGGFLDRDG
ncbi:LysR family transcriptional regulator [Jannaschia sp. KMU-145]|uniref:LysR family transcriptional regulator n=1 Tax=Jannaschia halovivens TaxID=3388667 RepID=UPI00396B444A